ncbi:LysR family transcriptional regulator [Pseudoalteromonas sp. JBTF-M23]|uniref:LysR family transcriptional regulator n=1 Tax=Pseudoalteromonas caenipelagi TaxID=2726988 RepID=A0A849VFD8_9GAMM|nr:LysR family transcriptional regulator [Pseudoalteromonas caenipelagi]NOU51468.1 LysR family transcriptional regulator [Pseudoalteromonas caenipelagi]
MIDELRALAIFAETVKQGSFRAAAQSLQLSPSVVSYQVSGIEKRLGVALLYRSTRRLSLTHEGEKLYQHAQAMLAAAQTGLSEINQNHQQLKGKLTISLPTALIKAPITRYLAQFSKQFPKVTLNVQYKDERSDLICEGIDLAVRAGDMPSSNLKSRRLGEIKRLMVCSSAYFEAKAAPKHIHDLADWNWISLAMLPHSRNVFNERGETLQIRYQSNITVNSIEAMTELCMLGLGVATPPDYLVKGYIEQQKMVQLFPKWQVEDIPLYAVWPNNVPQRGLVKSLLQFLSPLP